MKRRLTPEKEASWKDYQLEHQLYVDRVFNAQLIQDQSGIRARGFRGLIFATLNPSDKGVFVPDLRTPEHIDKFTEDLRAIFLECARLDLPNQLRTNPSESGLGNVLKTEECRALIVHFGLEGIDIPVGEKPYQLPSLAGVGPDRRRKSKYKMFVLSTLNKLYVVPERRQLLLANAVRSDKSLAEVAKPFAPYAFQ